MPLPPLFWLKREGSSEAPPWHFPPLSNPLIAIRGGTKGGVKKPGFKKNNQKNVQQHPRTEGLRALREGICGEDP